MLRPHRPRAGNPTPTTAGETATAGAARTFARARTIADPSLRSGRGRPFRFSEVLEELGARGNHERRLFAHELFVGVETPHERIKFRILVVGLGVDGGALRVAF